MTIMKKHIKVAIEIPKGVIITREGSAIKVKGPKGEIKRETGTRSVEILISQESITLEREKATKREKSKMFSLRAHINNAIRNVQQSSSYKLKICASHFPMNVTVQKGVLTIKNFVGEKVPRVMKLPQNVEVAVSGDTITVTGTDGETVGRTAGLIEQFSQVKEKDRRIFQDGIYIVEKEGVQV